MKTLLLTLLFTLSSLADDCLYTYKAFVNKVYDGDTITAIIDLGFNTQTVQNLRLAGVDTPEVRGTEREQGLVARDYLRELILNKEITVKTIKDKTGKYGRYLAIIYLEEENINELLLTKGYAEVYPKK